MELETRCSWCDKQFDEELPEGSLSLEQAASHSICLDCLVDLEIFDVFQVPDDVILNSVPIGELIIEETDGRAVVASYNTSEIDHLKEIQPELLIDQSLYLIFPFNFIPHIKDLISNPIQSQENKLLFLLQNGKSKLFAWLEIFHHLASKSAVLTLTKLKED